MSTWTDELKAKAVSMYEDGNPTPENSMELVKEIADELEQSPNGVRMVLSKAGVYVKKEPAKAAKAASGSATKAKEGGSTRVSKEAAHAALVEAIEDKGGTVDMEIISKLTGKAALYLADVVKS